MWMIFGLMREERRGQLPMMVAAFMDELGG